MLWTSFSTSWATHFHFVLLLIPPPNYQILRWRLLKSYNTSAGHLPHLNTRHYGLELPKPCHSEIGRGACLVSNLLLKSAHIKSLYVYLSSRKSRIRSLYALARIMFFVGPWWIHRNWYCSKRRFFQWTGEKSSYYDSESSSNSQKDSEPLPFVAIAIILIWSISEFLFSLFFHYIVFVFVAWALRSLISKYYFFYYDQKYFQVALESIKTPLKDCLSRAC